MGRILFTGIGVVVVGVALIWSVSNWLFLSRAEKTKGKVTKLIAGGSHPEVTFTTGDGKTIESSQGGLIFGYKVGDELNIYYDPKDPQNCSIDSSGALWGFPVLILVLGLAFVAVGLFSKT